MVLMRRHSWSCDAAPLPTAETMMGKTDDILDTPQLDYEAWSDLLRSMCGRYNPEGIEPNAFTGWVELVRIWTAPLHQQMNGNILSVDRPVPHITLMSATNRALTFQPESIPASLEGNGDAFDLAPRLDRLIAPRNNNFRRACHGFLRSH
jgi:hypothetical protein